MSDQMGVARTSMGIDPSICDDDARPVIEAYITLFDSNRPSLEQIWAAMDFAWDAMGIDNNDPDPEKLSKFYSHPVWLLNGLFIEQHRESLAHRSVFAEWISGTEPSRVVDFGGGFGTLARIVAERYPEACVEVLDPYPRPEAVRATERYENLSFSEKLEGEYDVIIATDVFEHVNDPVGLAFKVSAHIPVGGRFLTANHFVPSIKCHLPSTFHFNRSWDLVMARLGFETEDRVTYGTVYRRVKKVKGIEGARKVEGYSRFLYRIPSFRGSERIKRLMWRLTPV
jgi:hypothetical protein